MKVTTYEPRRLILDSVPWLMGVGIILAVLIMTYIAMRAVLREDYGVAALVGIATLMFPVAMFVVHTREQLILDRDLGEIVIRQRNILRGLQEDRYPLDQVRGTVVQWQDLHGKPRHYRMALVLGPPQTQRGADIRKDARFVPPFWDWGDEGTQAQRARIVEAWLAGEPQPDFDRKRRRGIPKA